MTAVHEPPTRGPTLPFAWHEQCEFEGDAARRDGYQQALHDIATRAVELETLNGHLWRAARTTAAQRLAQRLTDMEAFDVAAWLDAAARRHHTHDTQAVQAARRYPPTGDWRAVHAEVAPAVWVRIWADLSDRTRRSIADLDPTRTSRSDRRREAA